ncbi:STM3941 family protein [Accumulibacter sp.]|uniref:STM3941 family protein n=1 Tax=Accumulibacter sp. TaxID=2053492 RepID=UPI0025CE733B|nr:STM3941 family protein [Accumulibacter sp.]MCM8595785.1 hypothetical protein [Accumulibacter sp.]MCM8626506.1 hypothetical protein [Accumulibacter sp.]MDS4049933.1 STM3941 family protein [Accumulibacter sp.]
MEQVTIYPDPRRFAVMAVGSLVLAGIGGFLILDPEVSQTSRLFGGYVAVIFFVLCFARATSRLVRRMPSLIIDETGLFDNASSVCAGLLKWADISDVQVYSFKNQRFLGIALNDQPALYEQFSADQRQLMAENLRHAGYPVGIPASALGIGLDETLRLIARLRDRGDDVH